MSVVTTWKAPPRTAESAIRNFLFGSMLSRVLIPAVARLAAHVDGVLVAADGTCSATL